MLSPTSPPRPLVDCLANSNFLVELIEGGAAWLNHRRSAPINTRRSTLHRTDRGATIPWSSHPGEGRYSIRTEGTRFWHNATLRKKRKTNMSYQGKKNIPKITVSFFFKKNGDYACFGGCRNLMAGVANLWTSIFTAQRIPRIFTRPPARLRAEIFSPFHCQTWLQEAAGAALWPATIATGRQRDEAFS